MQPKRSNSALTTGVIPVKRARQEETAMRKTSKKTEVPPTFEDHLQRRIIQQLHQGVVSGLETEFQLDNLDDRAPSAIREQVAKAAARYAAALSSEHDGSHIRAL